MNKNYRRRNLKLLAIIISGIAVLAAVFALYVFVVEPKFFAKSDNTEETTRVEEETTAEETTIVEEETTTAEETTTVEEETTTVEKTTTKEVETEAETKVEAEPAEKDEEASEYTIYKTFEAPFEFGDAEVTVRSNDEMDRFEIEFSVFGVKQTFKGTVEDGVCNVDINENSLIKFDCQEIWELAVIGKDAWLKIKE